MPLAGGPLRRTRDDAIAMTSGWWRAVTVKAVCADALADLLGALLVLPQGIAFATLAGLPPQYGLFSAVVPTIVVAGVSGFCVRGGLSFMR